MHSGGMAVVQGGSTEVSGGGRVGERSNKLTRSGSVFDVDWDVKKQSMCSEREKLEDINGEKMKR